MVTYTWPKLVEVCGKVWHDKQLNKTSGTSTD